tara:strand:- start:35338 stop:35823 length:486 start_codon:yes stop_codon:yes gene_type:complete
MKIGKVITLTEPINDYELIINNKDMWESYYPYIKENPNFGVVTLKENCSIRNTHFIRGGTWCFEIDESTTLVALKCLSTDMLIEGGEEIDKFCVSFGNTISQVDLNLSLLEYNELINIKQFDKIGFSVHVLLKNGKLNYANWEYIKTFSDLTQTKHIVLPV